MARSATAGSLGKGGKWLAGVIVVALVGALVSQLVPRMFGPTELAAQLSRVSIDSGVSLEEYALRRGGAELASARVTAPPMQLVAVRYAATEASTGVPTGAAAAAGTAVTRDLTTTTAARSTTEGRTTPTPADDTTTGTQTTTTGEQTTTTGGQTTTTGTQTTTTGDDGSNTDDDDATTGGSRSRFGTDSLVELKVDASAQRKIDRGLRDALDAPRVPPALVLPPGCVDDVVSDGCGLGSLALTMGVAMAMAQADSTSPVGQDDVSVARVSKQLAKVFRGTRTRRARSDPSKRELVGVTINFNVALTGFRGESAEVRWSLYSKRGQRPVPRDWLRNQRALLLKGEAEKDHGSGEFWVPIPQVKGPFFIRLGVYDARGGRLDYADTPSFR